MQNNSDTGTSNAAARTPQFFRKNEQLQETYKKKEILYRLYQITWYVLGIVESFLGLRFLLKFFGANPASTFAALVYSITQPLTAPFIGVVQPTFRDNSQLEWSTLVAIFVYGLVAYGINELLIFFKPVSKDEVEKTFGNR